MGSLACSQDAISVSIASISSEIDPVIALFKRVALEEHWQPGNQLTAWQPRSLYLGVTVEGTLAGGLQIVLPEEEDSPFPFHTVWSEIVVDAPRHTAHISVMAVLPEYRGRLRLFWPLCVAMWRLCIERNIQTLTLEVTPSMLVRYRHLGWPLQQIGELRMHWGEPCILCKVDVQSAGGAMLARALRSPMYRVLIEQAMQPLHSPRCAA